MRWFRKFCWFFKIFKITGLSIQHNSAENFTTRNLDKSPFINTISWASFLDRISSVKRQKGEYRNECYKKTKQAKFSEKQKPLPVSGGKNFRFSENLACCFLVTTVLIFTRFYCRRYIVIKFNNLYFVSFNQTFFYFLPTCFLLPSSDFTIPEAWHVNK